jgi:hypothetical protein
MQALPRSTLFNYCRSGERDGEIWASSTPPELFLIIFYFNVGIFVLRGPFHKVL